MSSQINVGNEFGHDLDLLIICFISILYKFCVPYFYENLGVLVKLQISVEKSLTLMHFRVSQR